MGYNAALKAAAVLFWHKRQGSNLHIWESKSHALPFGYACICPRWATSLRGARGPVPHERCDLSALSVGCVVRAAYRGGRCEKMKSTAPRYGAGGKRHK